VSAGKKKQKERGMIRTDQAIKKALIDELYWDHRVDASDVKAEVSNGKVTLTGTVPSYSARTAAANAAWAIDGVSVVTNLLSVRFPPAFSVPTDAEIKTSAGSTLAWNPEVYSADIDVTVTDGVVRLEGTVDAYWKQWKAEDLVSNLRGVTEVENYLAVVPSDSFVDKDIARSIEAAFQRSMYVNAEDVTVKVENGKVTLTGTVSSYHARGRAYEVAALSSGVIAVDNHIVVTQVRRE
jgi:osmotically-inducible protein OsmY